MTGPPASICALNFGTTEPFDASTLPKRTEIRRIGVPPAARRAIVIERLAIHFRQPLGGAQHRDRLDRLVGRDHHHGGGAGCGSGVGDVDRAEHVGLDALVPVRSSSGTCLSAAAWKTMSGLNCAIRLMMRVAVANIGDAAGDLGLRLLPQRFQHGVQRRLGIFDHQQAGGAEGDDTIADFRADRAAAAGDDDRFAADELSLAADNQS